MSDPHSGPARVSFKCSDAMAQMLKAAARYEHRSESQLIRRALAAYFENEGYLDSDNIERLAAIKTGDWA